MAGKRKPERDEPVKLPLDPETALRALLAVNPDDEPSGDNREEEGTAGREASEECHVRRRERKAP
jgi:hypothetical protein